MAIDFPSAPLTGQILTSGAATYTWNGYAWLIGAWIIEDGVRVRHATKDEVANNIALISQGAT